MYRASLGRGARGGSICPPRRHGLIPAEGGSPSHGDATEARRRAWLGSEHLGAGDLRKPGLADRPDHASWKAPGAPVQHPCTRRTLLEGPGDPGPRPGARASGRARGSDVEAGTSSSKEYRDLTPSPIAGARLQSRSGDPLPSRTRRRIVPRPASGQAPKRARVAALKGLQQHPLLSPDRSHAGLVEDERPPDCGSAQTACWNEPDGPVTVAAPHAPRWRAGRPPAADEDGRRATAEGADRQ